MMFLARGLKCGGFGAIGLADAPGAAPSNCLSLSNDASAMPPRPIAQRPKKWRRVSDCSEVISCGEFMFATHRVSHIPCTFQYRGMSSFRPWLVCFILG